MSGNAPEDGRDDGQSGGHGGQGGQPPQGGQGGQPPQGGQGGQAGQQPAGQHGQPAQHGAQQPYAGGGDSIVDKLQEDAPMDAIKFSVGVYLALGVGYAITFLLASELSSGGSAQTFSVGAAFIAGLALAPLVAVMIGLRTGRELDEGMQLTAATTFVGTAAGVVVMSLVLFALAAVFSSGGGGGGGDLPIGTIVGFLVGVGATGAMAAYVGEQLGNTAGI